jgi:hypothetical protein
MDDGKEEGEHLRFSSSRSSSDSLPPSRCVTLSSYLTWQVSAKCSNVNEYQQCLGIGQVVCSLLTRVSTPLLSCYLFGHAYF